MVGRGCVGQGAAESMSRFRHEWVMWIVYLKLTTWPCCLFIFLCLFIQSSPSVQSLGVFASQIRNASGSDARAVIPQSVCCSLALRLIDYSDYGIPN